MLTFLRPQKTASSVAHFSTFLESAAYVFIIFQLLLGLSTTPVTSQNLLRNTQNVGDAYRKKIKASTMSPSQETVGHHPTAAGFTENVAISDSDGKSIPAHYGYANSDPAHFLNAGETENVYRGPDTHSNFEHFQKEIEGTKNRISNYLVSSEDPIILKDMRQQLNSPPKMRNGRQGKIAAQHGLSSKSKKPFYAHSRTVEDFIRRSRRAVTSTKGNVWPDGIIPYEWQPVFSHSARGNILHAMRTWESVTCVKFVEREPHHQANIKFVHANCGCCSYVGRQREKGTQTVSLGPGCDAVKIALHELGHALGFWHEQSRPDRDQYVDIIHENIHPSSMYNFDKMTSKRVNSLGEAYDYDSIMHYTKNAFAIRENAETIRPKKCCPRPEIGDRDKLSPSDIIQMNRLYSCPACGRTLLEVTGTIEFPIANKEGSNFRPQEAESASRSVSQSQKFANSEGMMQEKKLQSEVQFSTSSFNSTNRIFCQWRILAAIGERIYLQFTHMDMFSPAYRSQKETQGPSSTPNNSHNCTKQYVEVRDGYYSGSPLIGRYCGKNLPSKLTSVSTRMLIEYVQLQGQGGKGFVANYKISCDGYFKSDKGTFNSPGYPDAYFANRECTWIIKITVGYVVELTFTSFELEKNLNCSADHVEIYDGKSQRAPRLRRLCGTGIRIPILSTSNVMTVVFRSNDHTEKQGFKASFKKVSPAKLDSCKTTNHGCEHTCVNIPGGYTCKCNEGYLLRSDEQMCKLRPIKLDSCETTQHGCEHICKNIPDSFRCECYEDSYLLPDRKTCRRICRKHLKRDAGAFTSPGYPNQYPLYSNCTWMIEVPVGFSVVLTFSNFTLEGQKDCRNDYLEIHDGPSEHSRSLRKSCGLEKPTQVRSTGNTMTVRFVTDGVNQEKGFAARFEKSNCGGYLKGNKGAFNSPSYPMDYTVNARCTWMIEVPIGFSIALTFDSFQIEETFDCEHYRLEIYDGPSEKSPKLNRLCGNDTPKSILSTTNTMTVQYFPYYYSKEDRFAARYKKVPLAKLDSCTTTNHGCEQSCVNLPGGFKCECNAGYDLLPNGKSCERACGGQLIADEGIFTSPRYPENYPPKANCTWTIKVSVGSIVFLKFDDFKVEGQEDCPYDYVQFHDGPSEDTPILHRICGPDAPAPIKSTGNTMTVRFITDDFNEKKGFKARFKKRSKRKGRQ